MTQYNEKVQRNKNLYDDYKKMGSIYKVAPIYGISPQATHAIVKRLREKEEKEGTAQNE